MVAIGRNYQSRPFRMVRRRFGSSAELIAVLHRNRKINGRPCPQRSTADEIGTTLGSVANIRLGGVTGDGHYFLMTDKKRQELMLPTTAFTRVVSRACHLQSPFIDSREWRILKKDEKRVWLFNPSEAVTKHSAVRKYLLRRVGGCNRTAFKVANRNPWYRTPLPATPHAFLSGMTRFGPWLCINEMPRLNATNTLYVATFKNADENDRYGYALALLTTSVRRQLKRTGRRYADGLLKHEPSALAALQLPSLKGNIDFRSLYVIALGALLSGRTKEAMQIADSVFN